MKLLTDAKLAELLLKAEARGVEKGIKIGDERTKQFERWRAESLFAGPHPDRVAPDYVMRDFQEIWG